MNQRRTLTVSIGVLVLALVLVTALGVQRALSKPRTDCLPASIKTALAKADRACGIKVISTFRRGARIAGSGRPSKHATCEAADFTSRNYACVRNVLSYWPGKMSVDPFAVGHIHIDNGKHARFAHYGGKRHAKRYAKRMVYSARKRIRHTRVKRVQVQTYQPAIVW